MYFYNRLLLKPNSGLFVLNQGRIRLTLKISKAYVSIPKGPTTYASLLLFLLLLLIGDDVLLVAVTVVVVIVFVSFLFFATVNGAVIDGYE